MKNKNLVFSIYWMVIGIVLILLSYFKVIDSSYFSGMGTALAVIGFLRLCKYIKYKNDKDYKEKIDTQSNDERIIFLYNKAWAITSKIVILVLAIISIIAYIMQKTLMVHVLLYIISFMTFTFFIVYTILNKKY